jgi:hypothetical protein
MVVVYRALGPSACVMCMLGCWWERFEKEVMSKNAGT